MFERKTMNNFLPVYFINKTFSTTPNDITTKFNITT